MKALIIFVKAPVPDSVKTRLSAFLPAHRVVELYKSFITEIISKCRRLKRIDKFLGCAPTKDNDFLKKIAATYKLKSFNQRGKTLRDRIVNAFEEHFKKGYKEIVLIGSDSPTIPLEFIRKAFFELRKNELVIGPCCDRGLYLIGAKEKKTLKIFRNIQLETGEDISIILKKINSMNMRFSMLPFWYDIDTIEDLRFYKNHLKYLRKLMA